MTRADDQRIADIVDAASELAAIVELGAERFRTESILQRATERLLEIIGEAANALGADTKARHPEVPWADVTRLRIAAAGLGTGAVRSTLPRWAVTGVSPNRVPEGRARPPPTAGCATFA